MRQGSETAAETRLGTPPLDRMKPFRPVISSPNGQRVFRFDNSFIYLYSQLTAVDWLGGGVMRTSELLGQGLLKFFRTAYLLRSLPGPFSFQFPTSSFS